MAVPELIRIVSRDSPMALAQVERVRAELTAAHPGVGPAVVPGGPTRAQWRGGL
ncbi:hydroxymethylbilane synthase, partial [Streptomyces sp. MAD19A]